MAGSRLIRAPGSKVTDARRVRFASDGTYDALFTMENTNSAAGAFSSALDLGSTRWWTIEWWAWNDWATAKVAGETLDWYVIPAYEDQDGNIRRVANLSDTDGTLNTASLAALGRWFLGSTVVTVTTNTTPEVGSSVYRFFARYMSIGLWNATADNLSATAANHTFDVEFKAVG